MIFSKKFLEFIRLQPMKYFRLNLKLQYSKLQFSNRQSSTLQSSNLFEQFPIDLKLQPQKTSSTQTRQFSSALYITGDKASTTFSVLTPYLDLEERLKDKEQLQKNLKFRGYSIQVMNLEEEYLLYKNMEHEKLIAEIARSEISKRLNNLLTSPNKNEEDILKLRTPAEIAKTEYKDIKTTFEAVEEVTALKILSLPNVLHPKTPLEENEVAYNYLDIPKGTSKSHLELAGDLVEFENPSCVVLKNEAALFELACTNYFQNYFLSEGFTQFSNCDFVRSVVAEGCGNTFQSKFSIFTLDDEHNEVPNKLARNHLVGGASLFPFMAYFTKHYVQSGYIPLRLFSNGRKYNPVLNPDKSLFNVTQATGLQVFIATTETDSALDEELEKLEKNIIKLYEPLGFHFRLSYLKCNQLEKAESLRLSIEMFSPHLDGYVEVGNVSVYDKYLSKRLLFTYGGAGSERKFLNVISGTVLNVQRMLGCALENNQVDRKVLMSDFLRQYVYNM